MSVRGLKIGLVVSILLNVFIIGAVVGGIYRWRHGDTPRAVAALAGGRLRAAGDALEPQARLTYRQALREAARASRATREDVREARGAALEAFTAAQFDRAKVEAALARARTGDFATRARVEQAIVDVAQTLSIEQRQTLAAGLRSGPLRQPPQRPATE